MELNGHAQEEMLEEHSLGKLPDAEAESLEEHLLICPQCQDRLAEVEEFAEAARRAAARLQREPRSSLEGKWRGLWQWLARPAPLAVAAGVAILVAGSVVVWRGVSRNEPVVSVYLQAVRGGEGLVGARAPADKRLRLQLDSAGLPAVGSFRLEIVDSGGTGVFEAEARRDAGEVSAQLTARLPAGRYWVRLYEPRPAGPLLREFGLTVE